MFSLELVEEGATGAPSSVHADVRFMLMFFLLMPA
jgi:hypothetical protein